jgi:GTPase SAR1 family protein
LKAFNSHASTLEGIQKVIQHNSIHNNKIHHCGIFIEISSTFWLELTLVFKGRMVWDKYFPGVSAVLFLVDAADVERLPEAKKELDALLAAESLQNVPFLILGNKIDIPRCLSEEQLRNELGLGVHLTTGKVSHSFISHSFTPSLIHSFTPFISSFHLLNCDSLIRYR